jgi:hypothetical protein
VSEGYHPTGRHALEEIIEDRGGGWSVTLADRRKSLLSAVWSTPRPQDDWTTRKIIPKCCPSEVFEVEWQNNHSR